MSMTEVADPPSIQGNSRFNVFRAVRHVHQTAEKFRFELLVEQCMIRVPTPRRISVEWVRGPKRTRSQESVLLTKNQWIAKFQQPLVLIATLFRSALLFKGSPRAPNSGNEGSGYACKETKLNVLQFKTSSGSSPNPRRRVIGEVRFDLSQLVQNRGAAETSTRLELPLQKSLDPTASLILNIKCTPLGVLNDDEQSTLYQREDLLESISSDDSSVARTPSFGPEQNDALPSVPSSASSGSLSHPLSESAESSLSPAATSPTPTTRRISLAKLIRPGFATAPSATEGSSAAVKPQRSSVHHSTEPQTMLSKTCPQTSLSETHTGRRSRQTSGCETDVASKLLLSRISDLDQELQHKSATIDRMRRTHQEELRNIEDQLSAERSRHLEVQRSTANALAERDDHVTRLLECVSELHTALERAQKMTILDTDSTKKSDQESPVEKTLRQEVFTLRRRLKEANQEVESQQKAWEVERAKRTKQIAVFEQYVADQQKNFSSVKTGLEKKVALLRDDVKCVTELATAESDRRGKIEKEITQLRRHFASTDGAQASAQQLLSYQQEVTDLTTLRDTLRRSLTDQRKQYQQRLETLESIDRQRHREATIEERRAEIEKRALRDRIMELEKHLSVRPRPSMTKLLQAETSQALLRQQAARKREDGSDYDRHVVEVLAAMHDMQQRVEEIEQELIEAKVKLAESETRKDELMMKARKRFEAMRERMRTYAALVTGLEVEVSDLKMQSAKVSKKTVFSSPGIVRTINNLATKVRGGVSEPEQQSGSGTPSQRGDCSSKSGNFVIPESKQRRLSIGESPNRSVTRSFSPPAGSILRTKSAMVVNCDDNEPQTRKSSGVRAKGLMRLDSRRSDSYLKKIFKETPPPRRAITKFG